METLLTAKTALLQALMLGPAYGLELIARVKKASGGKIALGQGTVYPTLRALERDGLLQSWEGESPPERGGRPRRYYELTAEGLRAAQEENRILRQVAGVLSGASR